MVEGQHTRNQRDSRGDGLAIAHASAWRLPPLSRSRNTDGALAQAEGEDLGIEREGWRLSPPRSTKLSCCATNPWSRRSDGVGRGVSAEGSPHPWSASNSASNVFASWRSAVSNPSMNQP